MKIGIVTQPLHNNYGGLLQNFALQQVLKKLGHEVKTIDFVYQQSFLKYLRTTCKQILVAIFKCKRPQITPYKKFPTARKSIITTFVENHIARTRIVHSYSSNIVKEEKFDAVITGSDQVWRPIYNVYIENMFLKFVPNNIKKIAYAASFGVDNWEYSPKLTYKCAKQAQLLDAISVREFSGIELCKKYLKVDAQCVLDPTLLAGTDAYSSLLKEYNGENYVFAYILDLTPEIREFIKKIANILKLEINITNADNNATLSVEKWVSMIANASMVITDSFHGTVFSILFHREFYSIINRERGKARFYSLIQPLGLENRLLDTLNLEGLQTNNIDWNTVDYKLDSMRENSTLFLKKALSNV